MYFPTTLIILATAAFPALSAPAPEPADKSMMAATNQWTITSFKRTCNSGNTSCTWEFGIDTHSGNPTACKYTSTASKNASNASVNGKKCGVYTVSSNWSGQFGPGNGFTTLAVTNQKNIVYPAYRDTQLKNGVAVSPNQSYAPQALP